jgi:hypothetical protein
MLATTAVTAVPCPAGADGFRNPFYPRAATGNVAPLRTLSGAATGLSNPISLAVAAPAAPVLISTGTGPGGGPHVRLFRVTNLETGEVVQVGGGFFAYDAAFTGGVNVGAP